MELIKHKTEMTIRAQMLVYDKEADYKMIGRKLRYSR